MCCRRRSIAARVDLCAFQLVWSVPTGIPKGAFVSSLLSAVRDASPDRAPPFSINSRTIPRRPSPGSGRLNYSWSLGPRSFLGWHLTGASKSPSLPLSLFLRPSELTSDRASSFQAQLALGSILWIAGMFSLSVSKTFGQIFLSQSICMGVRTTLSLRALRTQLIFACSSAWPRSHVRPSSLLRRDVLPQAQGLHDWDLRVRRGTRGDHLPHPPQQFFRLARLRGLCPDRFVLPSPL